MIEANALVVVVNLYIEGLYEWNTPYSDILRMFIEGINGEDGRASSWLRFLVIIL